jgi:regulator of sirC expression with transglutaminase-like and TPR domain
VNAPTLPSSLLSLLRFEQLARLPDRRIDLTAGALLIAEIAEPDLSHARYRRQLDAMAAAVRAELGREWDDAAGTRSSEQGRGLGERATAERAIGALRDVLALREGLRGNQEDYYDPRNSYLSDVLETRRGLPITLSVVYLEVARRLDLPLVGVGLPMHFVVKWPLSRDQGGDLFVDAFSGAQVWSYEECRARVMARVRANAGVLGFDPRWTRPVGPRAILSRMLDNLKTIYLTRGETQLAHEAVERLLMLRPDAHEELRDRGLLRLTLNEPLLGAADIAAYVERAPRAPEVGRLRRRVLQSRELRLKLN